MPPELDADIAATLTPEELEAINADDSPTEHDIMRAGEDGDDDDDGDDADDDSADDAPPAEGKDTPADATAPADDTPDEPGDAPAPAAPEAAADKPATRYEAQLPSDYDAQLKTLKDRDAELRQRYKDGEIDIDERDAGLSGLTEEREALLVARTKAEISQEMSAQSAQQQWQNTVNRAMADFAKPENGGIDYRKDEAKAADLDQFVKVLANRAENNDKPMEWFLSEAHKRVQALHGVKVPEPDAKRKAMDDALAKRKPPLASAPKNLSQVPGGDGPGDVASEFADIDALDGQALEDAIARMTPTQRSRYLAA
jgi:hypothetical protein